MKGKNVVIAIPVLLTGGTEIQTLALVRVLANAGYKVTVCCYHENEPGMILKMKEAGAEVILMNEARSAGAVSLVLRLRKLFRSIKPDIVHVQYLSPGFLPVMAARLAGVRTVFATVHQPGRIFGKKERVLLRTAAKFCSAFFCNSQAVELSWFGSSNLYRPGIQDKRGRHFTIYNAVDSDGITDKIAETDLEALRDSLGLGGRFTLGVVGRLRSEKGQSVLLEAMPDIIRDIPEAALVVVGDGPDMEALQARARALGIDRYIVWTGRKDVDYICRLYGIMDLVIVPSLFEGFGLVAAEAMAAGRPVIASNIDGLAELVDDGVTGLLVPHGSSKSIARAVKALFDRPDMAKSMGQKGYTKMKSGFSPKHFAAAVLNAYQVLK